MKLVDKHFPLRKIHTKHRESKPWMTKGLRQCCIKKNCLYKLYLSNKTSASEQDYKMYKNKLTNILKISKRQYYCSLIEKHKVNMKQTWKIWNEITRRKIAHKISPMVLNMNDRLVKIKNEIACVFNDYFINIGKLLADKIKSPKQNVIMKPFKLEESTFFLKPTNRFEICKIIQGQRSKNLKIYLDLI